MARMPKKKQSHAFTLIYRGPKEAPSDAQIHALYEAGCDDALIGRSGGRVLMHFEREAPSFRAALLSAIADVECSGVPLELIRVESEPPEPPSPKSNRRTRKTPAGSS